MVSPAALVRTLLIAAFAALLAFAPASAQQVVTVTTTVTWTYDTGDDADDAGIVDESAALLADEGLAEDADLGTTRRYAPSATLATSLASAPLAGIVGQASSVASIVIVAFSTFETGQPALASFAMRVNVAASVSVSISVTAPSGNCPIVPITSGWPAWPISSTWRPRRWWRMACLCTFDTSGQVASR